MEAVAGGEPPIIPRIGGEAMNTYQAIYLMIAFGTFIIALLSYIDKRK